MRVRWSWRLAETLSWLPVGIGLRVRSVGRARGLVEERLDFGRDSAQHLLFMRPEGASPETPFVYFVHGGSWHAGSPQRYRAVGRFLARHGYAAALAGYRLAPGAVFPAQLHDTLDGLAAALRHARGVGLSADRVLLVGQSAGAHLAALAAFDTETREKRGLGAIDIAGLLAISGPLDFAVLCPRRSLCPAIERLMGGPDGWETADPARFAHAGPDVPVLCLHGSRDPLVPPEVAASFVLRVNGSEGDHATFMADPAGHHADLTRLFFGSSPLTPAMLAWMAEVARA
jgi:acetyl esterase/lipase